MASQTLVVSDPTYLAEFVRQEAFKGIFEKRFSVPPDYAALLFRNGELVDAFKGAHLSVGGLSKALKSLIVGSSHVGLLIADLKPFQVQTSLTATSKDKVEVAGVITMELQVNPDKPSNILGMMSVRLPLTKNEVLDRIRPHLTDRVFEAAVRRIEADKLRGETGAQDLVQGEVMKEVARIAGDLGLIVRAVSIEWAANRAEMEAMQRAQIERDQEMMDFALEVNQRELEREKESTELKIQTKVDLAKLESTSEDELALMVLNSELEFVDARETGQRVQEMKALQHEIELLRTERLVKFENEIQDAEHLIDLTKKNKDLTQYELEIQKLEKLQGLELENLERRQKIELDTLEGTAKLDIASRANEESAKRIRDLQDIESRAAEAETDLDIKKGAAAANQEIAKEDAAARARVDQMKAAKDMTPEQLLAFNAGFSSDVAAAIAEQARAKSEAEQGQSTMEVMREMVNMANEARISSEQQARDFFKAGMEGAVGVAQGASGGQSASVAGGGSVIGGSDSIVECSNCGRENSAKAKFCTGCGQKLRV